MVGSSGTGKTEVPEFTFFSTYSDLKIARRMAEMTGAPFIKVEATKFTEVGFKGAGEIIHFKAHFLSLIFCRC